MKIRFVILGLLISLSVSAQDKLSLDGDWSFKVDPYKKGEAQQWYHSKTNYENWDSMKVPGNWDLYNEYSEYAGDAWYSRTFKSGANWDGKQVRLIFESVYNDCQVWVNGTKVGENHIGFLEFGFDISNLIQAGTNRITLKVNNLFKRGAIWNWGGIRRPVWLEITDPVRLEYQHIMAIPNLKNKSASIQVKVVASNSSPNEASVACELAIRKDGKLLVQKKLSAKIPANTKEHIIEFPIKLSKSKTKFWHFDYPELYECSIDLIRDAKKVHQIHDRFGIRKIEIAGNKLLLNGEEIRPVGFNLVPEDRVTGNTLPFERIKEDVDMLKELGVNFCRISHLPLPKEYLDYLDEKGLMTFEEVALWGKDKWVDPKHPMPKEWLSRMIQEKYNHPSVVGWSVGNEIGYLNANPKVMEYVKAAIEMSKKLDPNRLAVYVSHSANNQKIDPVEFSDLIMLNSYGNWGKAAQKAWEKHKKPIFMCEYGGVLNHEDPNLANIDAAKMLNQMRNKEYLLGASLWTFNDYRSFWHGGKGWATPVSQNRCWGIVNTFRQKKRAYADFKNEYAPVKGMEISKINEGAIAVSIEPRDKLDIPANILKGYSVVSSIANANFEFSKLGSVQLKNILPGDNRFTVEISGKTKDASAIKIQLLDPQNYVVLEKIKYLSVPNQAKISFTNTAQNGVRILFDKVQGAEEYFVSYTNGDKVFYSDTTINQFVTITDKKIKRNIDWEYRVIALNGKGASKASEKVVLKKDEDELPPVIWDVKRDDTDVVIGFTSSPYDYLYEVEYGNQSGVYHKMVSFKTKGVARIPDICHDEPLYLRLRLRKQWGFASEWTQEIKVD
ncbi:glycoside hydrolase family 2 protein [Marinifilum sp.]|uniref:glycoside hydrolase family 2 protein n=1 Tax=Marinifilum sp. TaxID=2033137 RepID=UPI003BADA189